MIRVQEQQHADNIDVGLLLSAYCRGYFPMAEHKEGAIRWYSPDPRAIIELDQFHIPRSLRQVIRKNIFEIRINTSFETVIRECSNRDDTWISEAIIKSYCRLFELGFAHSVEAWKDSQLAGGLYGVAIGAAFFGESMFTRVSNASKACLVYLVNNLKQRGYQLLDVQFVNDHLKQFNVTEIQRSIYLQRLQQALQLQCTFY